MQSPHVSHGSVHVPLKVLGGCALLCVIALMMGYAQRVHINAAHGNSYKSVFYQQASTPAVRLAPTTSEDAKRISKSRARRSDSNANGRGRGGINAGSLGLIGN